MRKYILILFFVFLQVAAQQKPHFTQYMYNMSTVNPAYATNTEGILNLGSLYRMQWAGVEGAPKTFTFFGHVPVNRKFETGLSVVADDIGKGVIQTLDVAADFAYLLKLGYRQRNVLSFGVKGGFNSLNTNLSSFDYLSNPADGSFTENITEITPTVGAGIYFFGTNYYFGASSPNLLSGMKSKEASGVSTLLTYKIHSYITAGYVYELSEEFKLKPAIMTIIVPGAPLSMDFTVNALYLNKFEMGLSYRLDDSVSLLANINVLPNLRVGYAYDYITSSLTTFSNGSHEFVMLYNLNLIGKGSVKSPRFF